MIYSTIEAPYLKFRNNAPLYFLLALILSLAACKNESTPAKDPALGLGIYEKNPFYWTYQGQPILLLGGTKEDNIFQIDDLREHLELLQSVGGNYIRCTLSSRDEGNIRPYLKNEEGYYDLNQPNPDYWEKIRNLLTISKELDIIVQIEIWATYDFYWGDRRWSDNPFNPKVNINYSPEESSLPDSIAYPAQMQVNPFFASVPDLDNNELLIAYQQQFVDKVLEVTLPFDNVLYCIDNETNAHFAWGKYWAKYIREKAAESDKEIFITEMWDHWDPTNGAVKGAKVQHPDLGGWYAEYTNPELHEFSNYSYSIQDTISYDFVDIGNHNAQDGQIHYNTGIWVRSTIKNSGKIRPINNVKIYGADASQLWSGSIREGQERFWRNIFAGHASARFHRPGAGIGLSKFAQNNIRSVRMLTESVDLFSFEPNQSLFSDRTANEVYGLSNGKDQYLIYFPTGGVVKLNLPEGEYSVRSLRIDRSYWLEPKIIRFPGVFASPHDEAWGFIIEAVKE